MVAVTAIAVSAALTIAVTGSTSLALDSCAFQIADDLRAPWLDDAARLFTKVGLIGIVGSAVLLGAALLSKPRDRARAAALVIGAALGWISVPRSARSPGNQPRLCHRRPGDRPSPTSVT